METRDQALLAIRPMLPNIRFTEGMSDEEKFQNKTIRPIAKLQNDLFAAVFKNYIKTHKNVWFNLNIDKRLEYIDNAIQKDMTFRSYIIGLIIGQFSAEEYDIYVEKPSALNKRMINIVKERLKSNMMQFEIASD